MEELKKFGFFKSGDSKIESVSENEIRVFNFSPMEAAYGLYRCFHVE
jgi:hypothetical protein